MSDLEHLESESKRLLAELEKIIAEIELQKGSGKEVPAGDKEQSGCTSTEGSHDNPDAAGTIPGRPTASKPEAREPPIEKQPVWKWLLPRAFDVLLAAVMVVATLMFLQNDDPHKSLFGYRYYFVQSGSMEPELPTGSFILVKMTEPDEIHVGDNVAFYFQNSLSEEPEFWTHKVIEVIRDTGTTQFQTQGIANAAPDPFVLDGENVIGKVIYCNRYLGPVMMFASQNPLPLLAVVAAFFIFLHAVGKYRRKQKEEKYSQS